MRRLGRAVLLLLIAAAVVVLLFTVVFPWFDRTFVTDPVLDSRSDPAAVALTAQQVARRAAGGGL